jgi:hypothetical protein
LACPWAGWPRWPTPGATITACFITAGDRANQFVEQRAPSDAGVPGGYDLAALLESVDEETGALARAVLVDGGPDPLSLSAERQAYELTQCGPRGRSLEQRRLTRRPGRGRAGRHRETTDAAQDAGDDEERRSLDQRRDQFGCCPV